VLPHMTPFSRLFNREITQTALEIGNFGQERYYGDFLDEDRVPIRDSDLGTGVFNVFICMIMIMYDYTWFFNWQTHVMIELSWRI